jgi:hypothetical protein
MSNPLEFLEKETEAIQEKASHLIDEVGLITLAIGDDGRFSFLVFDKNGESIPYGDNEDPIYTAGVHLAVGKILSDLGQYLDKRAMTSLVVALRD